MGTAVRAEVLVGGEGPAPDGLFELLEPGLPQVPAAMHREFAKAGG